MNGPRLLIPKMLIKVLINGSAMLVGRSNVIRVVMIAENVTWRGDHHHHHLLHQHRLSGSPHTWASPGRPEWTSTAPPAVTHTCPSQPGKDGEGDFGGDGSGGDGDGDGGGGGDYDLCDLNSSLRSTHSGEVGQLGREHGAGKAGQGGLGFFIGYFLFPWV